MKNMPRVFDLVVMNHEADATLYRVKELGEKSVGVIDATIEDAHPNQSVQWVALSLLIQPTNAQMKRAA